MLPKQRRLVLGIVRIVYEKCEVIYIVRIIE